MQLLSRKLPYSHRILLVSDLHEGAAACHRKGWKRAIVRVKKEKNTFMALGGDLIEAICVDDFRWSHETQDTDIITPLAQIDYVFDDLHDIKDKVLFSLIGNHELKVLKFGNLMQYACSRMGIPYGGYTTKFTVIGQDNKPAYKFFYTHGRRGINSVADDPLRVKTNMRLSVKRALRRKAADCVVMAMGHCHKLLVSDPVRDLYLTDDGQDIHHHYTEAPQHAEYIPPDLRWYCATGSFLKTFLVGPEVTYSEAAQMDPVDAGYVEIVCQAGKVTEVVATVL